MKSGSWMRAVLCCVGLFGCDDGVEGSSASCRAYCNKLEVCDDATDVLGCEQKCTEQRVRSEAYLSARASCADKLSCNVFSGEITGMGEDRCASGERCRLSDCTENTLADQKPTADQTSYCSRVVTKLNACDRTLETTGLTTHCLDIVPTLSTAYLDEVSGCIEGDCAQVSSCLQRTADRFDTTLSLYPSAGVQVVVP